MMNELESDRSRRSHDGVAAERRTGGPRSRPAWRAVLLVVVLLGGVVVGTVVLLRREAPISSVGGPAAQTAPAPPQRTLATVVAAPLRHGVHGALVFHWHPVEGADTYVLRLFSGEFQEVARFETNADSLVLSRDDIAKLQLPSKKLLWRVVAAHGDQDLATSPVATDRLP